MKSGNLNFLETSGPLRACNGTALLMSLDKLFILGSKQLKTLIPDWYAPFWTLDSCTEGRRIHWTFDDAQIVASRSPGMKARHYYLCRTLRGRVSLCEWSTFFASTETQYPMSSCLCLKTGVVVCQNITSTCESCLADGGQFLALLLWNKASWTVRKNEL